MFPTDVVIVAGARTPMARYTGIFSEVSAIELGAHAAKAALQRRGGSKRDRSCYFRECFADERGCHLWRAACRVASGIEDGNAGSDRKSPVRVRN